MCVCVCVCVYLLGSHKALHNPLNSAEFELQVVRRSQHEYLLTSGGLGILKKLLSMTHVKIWSSFLLTVVPLQVFQDCPHTSLSNALPTTPWQLDVHIPILQVKASAVVDKRMQGCLSKTLDLCTSLQTFFRSDNACSRCKQILTECSCNDWCPLPSHTTFQPTSELLQRLPHAGRTVGDGLHRFGRVGSPFSGFSLDDIEADDDKGCFLSLLHLSCLCTPLFTYPSDHGQKESESNSFCALLRLLCDAADRKVQTETARNLRTVYVNRQSPQPLRETTTPGNMLRTLIGDFPQDYIQKNMGVVDTTKTQLPNTAIMKVPIMHIQGPARHTIQSILDGSAVNGRNWSATGNFFWVEIDLNAFVHCEPELKTSTDTWYMLGFISSVTSDQKRWVTTLRDHDTNTFFVMDHPTSHPKKYDMKFIGVHNPSLVLYGKNKQPPQSWLRPRASSNPPRPQHSSPFDLHALERDGLVTGTVDDLLRRCKCSPNLQSELLKDIVTLLNTIHRERQGTSSCSSAIKVTSVQGWPMPTPNHLSLVYDSNGASDPRAGTVRSTKDFGRVPLKTKATSPTVPGISLMVSSACDVCVQIDGVVFLRVYILTIPFVISCIRTSKIWNLLSRMPLETQSTRTHDNY